MKALYRRIRYLLGLRSLYDEMYHFARYARSRGSKVTMREFKTEAEALAWLESAAARSGDS